MTHGTRKRLMAAALWIGGIAAFLLYACATATAQSVPTRLDPLGRLGQWTPKKLAPVAWFAAEDNALDSSGNGNNGTGSPGYVAGVVAQAFNSTGTVTIADAASMRPGTNDFTVAFWRKEPDANAAYVMASKRLTSGTFNQITITHGSPTAAGGISANKRLGLFLIESSAANRLFMGTTSDVWNGAFRHIVIRRSAGAVCMCVDGAVAETTNIVSVGVNHNVNNNAAWKINDQTSAGSATDDFLYFGRALSDQEVATLYSESVKQSAKGVAW